MAVTQKSMPHPREVVFAALRRNEKSLGGLAAFLDADRALAENAP